MSTIRPLWRELLGAALRAERHRQQRTLSEIATVSGVSTQHLSDMERGRKDPSSEVLDAVAGALGLDVPTLARRIALGADHEAARDPQARAGRLRDRRPTAESSDPAARHRSVSVRPGPEAGPGRAPEAVVIDLTTWRSARRETGPGLSDGPRCQAA